MVCRLVPSVALALLLGAPAAWAAPPLTVADDQPELQLSGHTTQAPPPDLDAPPPRHRTRHKRAKHPKRKLDPNVDIDGDAPPPPPPAPKKPAADDADAIPDDIPPPPAQPAAPAPSTDAAPAKPDADTGSDDDSWRDEDKPKAKPKAEKPRDDDQDQDGQASDDKDKGKDEDSGDQGDQANQPAVPTSHSFGVHAGWGAVAGHAPNGRMIFGEVGLPGIRALYLVQKSDNFAYGGGGELDIPPLAFQGNSPRGFNAVRFIGRVDYYLPTDLVQLFVRFEPQWIAIFGDSSVGGLAYLPVELGAGFDLSVVHLALSAGAGPEFTGSSGWFPFTGLLFASPFVGAAGELPLSDSLALTLRLRLQTYAWDTPGPDRSPTLVGLGFVMAGVAYRY